MSLKSIFKTSLTFFYIELIGPIFNPDLTYAERIKL
jgi:hypothetical protein